MELTVGTRYPQHRLEHLPVLHPLRPSSLAFKIISADKGFVLMVLEVGTAPVSAALGMGVIFPEPILPQRRCFDLSYLCQFCRHPAL